MKKILLVVIALVCAYVSNAQNNVYGKKVVGLDSVVTNSINARAGDVVTVLKSLAVDEGLTVTDDAEFNANVSLESSLPVLRLRDTDDINNTGRIYFLDGTNSLKSRIQFDPTNGFDFTTTSSFTFDGGDADFGGNLTASDATFSGDVEIDGSFIDLGNGGTNGRSALLTSSAISGIYLSNNNAGTAPFDQKGSVIIQPRSDAAGRSVAIATGSIGSEAVAMLIDDNQDATFSGDIIASSGDIYLGASSPSLTLSGGSNGSSGGQIQLNGEGAGAADDIIFLASGTEVGRWDQSANHWEFSNKDFVEIGNATFSGDVSVSDGITTLTRDSGNPLFLNRNTNAGLAFEIRQANTAVGQHRVNATTNLYQVQSASGMTLALGSGNNNHLSINSSGNATFSGNLALSAYGGGSKTGTATYALGVDLNGNVIETSASGGGVGSSSNTQILYNDGGSVNGNSAMTFNGSRIDLDGSTGVEIEGFLFENSTSGGLTLSNDGSNNFDLKQNTIDKYLRIEKTTNGVINSDAALRINHQTNNNMSDGFGSAIIFEAEDVAGVKNLAGVIGVNRDGADDDYSVYINPYYNGGQTSGITLDNTNFWAPKVYTATTSFAANVTVSTQGKLLRSTSSLKYKKNIQNLDFDWSTYNDLRPVTYQPKDTLDKNIYIGFIAEEVDSIGYNELVQYDTANMPDALNYGHFTALNAKAIQELYVMAQQQNNIIVDLTARIEELEARLDSLEN